MASVAPPPPSPGMDMAVDDVHETEPQPQPQLHPSAVAPAPPLAVGDRVRVREDGGGGDNSDGAAATAWSGVVRRLTAGQALVHPFGPASGRWDAWVPRGRLEKQSASSSSSAGHVQRHQHYVSNKENRGNDDDDDTDLDLDDAKRRSKRKSPPREAADGDTDGGGGGSADAAVRQEPEAPRRRQRLTHEDFPPYAHPHYFAEQDLALALPFTLQTVLVEEHEAICRSGLWHALPAAVTIEKVLDHFAKRDPATVTTPGDDGGAARQHHHYARRDFCRELRELFQRALPKLLLYAQERPQYEALLRQQSEQHAAADGGGGNAAAVEAPPLVRVYGCEFLLRLLLRLPLLGYLPPPVPAAGRGDGGSGAAPPTVAQHLSDLIVLLQKNRQACFGKNKYVRAADVRES